MPMSNAPCRKSTNDTPERTPIHRRRARLCIAFGLLLTGICSGSTHCISAAELTRCNGFNDPGVTWAAVAGGAEQPLPLHPITPPVLLPDGTQFKTWEQSTAHRSTFFVAQQHPQAADNNPGTETRPWKTIGRAAAALEPGDRVIVKQGHYREWIRPARGGLGPEQMVTYQAAHGEQVILSGSDPLVAPWLPSKLADQPPIEQAWMIDLPTDQFQGYNPLAEPNLGAAASGNPYFREAWKKPPYTLPCGLVFQDDRRLLQVAEYPELAEADGTYWVEPGGRRLHIRPFGDTKPQNSAFDVTTRPFAFAPEQAGLGFIRVDGFIVEHVANCFPVPQFGAISTMQGHHWIVENNVIRQVNGLGMDYGRRHTFVPFEVPPDTPELAGVGHIIRRNAFLDCGVCSLSGLGLIGGLVEDNYSRGCGWHRVMELLESAGIKLLYVKHSVVRRNVVQGTVDVFGLWIDNSNHNARVTQNIIVGTQASGVYFEASYTPNLIDHNIIWDCAKHGFYLRDTGSAIITNNLVGCCGGQPVTSVSAKSRMLDIETKRMSSVERNRIVGNVFYGFGSRGPEIPNEPDNESDFNVFVNPPNEKPFDLAAWQQKTGRETQSITAASRMELTHANWMLRQTPLLSEVQCPHIDGVTSDFFGTPRPAGNTTQAGPFLLSDPRPELLLRAPLQFPGSE